MSFILKFVRRRCPIDVRRDILNVEGQDPLIVFTSFHLKRVYGLERKNGNCMRSVIIRHLHPL